jgi:hypothetical protein
MAEVESWRGKQRVGGTILIVKFRKFKIGVEIEEYRKN